MISPVDITRRTLGVTFTADQQANVVVWAPLAKEVAISINDQSVYLPLTNDSSGYWQLTTDQLKPGDTYMFVLDDEKEMADPAALAQPLGIYGPSEAFDTTHFYWEESSWINPAIDEYIVYEIDIHTFTEEGSLKAITKKLSHLKKLGVNAILIRPVTPFLDSRNRPQDAAFLFAVQASYGGPARLQQLVNACHYEGIAVIADLPYSPFDRQERTGSDFGTYLPRKQPTDSTKTRPVNDTYRHAHRRYLVENALIWFRDFHIDALRLDVAHAMLDAEELLQEIRACASALTAKTGRQYYLLVEHDLTLASGTNAKTNSGGRDRTCNQYYADYNLNRHKTKTYRKDCLCDSTFSKVLQELFEQEAEMMTGEAFVTILHMHNQGETQSMDDHSDQEIGSEMLKLMAGSIMVSPCIPTLFMGEEWGVTNPFRKLAGPELAMAESGQETRYAMAEAADVTLPWETLDEQPNQTLYQYYQALTALRRQQPALHHLNSKQASMIYRAGEPTLLLQRSYKTNQVLCLMNFSKEKQNVTIPSLGKSWQKILDSADPIWDGPASSPDRLPDNDTFTLQPESIVVYKAQA